MSGSTRSPPTYMVCSSLLPHAGLRASPPRCSPSRAPARPSPRPLRCGPRPRRHRPRADLRRLPRPGRRPARRRHPRRRRRRPLLRVAALPVRGTRRAQPPPAPAAPAPSQRSCQRPPRVQNISFSKTKYPHIRRHFRAALPPRLAAHARAQPPRRRRPPRPPARGHPDPRRLRPRRVPAGGRPRQRHGPRARHAARAAGRPTSPTSRAPRTAPTARRWASSCGASATAPASATSSTDGARGKLELGRRRVRRPDRRPDRHRRDRRGGDLAGGDRRPVRLDAIGARDLGRLRSATARSRSASRASGGTSWSTSPTRRSPASSCAGFARMVREFRRTRIARYDSAAAMEAFRAGLRRSAWAGKLLAGLAAIPLLVAIG